MPRKNNMMDPATARTILQQCNAPLADDFDKLNSSVVFLLLEAANTAKYRKPANANGSRARYFHAYLQRRAARKD